VNEAVHTVAEKCPSHCALTRVHVVIEHVDFYMTALTLIAAAHVHARPQRTNRLDLCVVLREFCCNCTQYGAVVRSISIVALYCVQLQRHASTDVHARARAQCEGGFNITRRIYLSHVQSVVLHNAYHGL